MNTAQEQVLYLFHLKDGILQDREVNAISTGLRRIQQRIQGNVVPPLLCISDTDYALDIMDAYGVDVEMFRVKKIDTKDASCVEDLVYEMLPHYQGKVLICLEEVHLNQLYELVQDQFDLRDIKAIPGLGMCLKIIPDQSKVAICC